MGNDGGSIPTRRELVKEGAREATTTSVKEIQVEQQEHYWTTCALSHQPLSEPVVSDALGTLYNKDAVLSHLLAENQKDILTPIAELEAKKEAFKDRLRSLRDVVEVKFQHAEGSENVVVSKDGRRPRWICPITNKVLGPGTKAIYLVPCGHAFAESLIATVPGERCLQCDEAYEPDNIITILPTSQTVKDRLQARVEDLKAKGLTHSLKKAPKDSSGKKRKKAGPDVSELEGPAVNSVISAPTKITNQKPSINTTAIQNKDTAALTERVLKEQDDRNKRRKMAANENVESLFSKGQNNVVDGKRVDFMTRGFSIPATSVKR